MASLKDHWEEIYKEKPSVSLGWYQESPSLSLRLIEGAGLPKEAPCLDAGAGCSLLADQLKAIGYQDLSLVDWSLAALEQVKGRLGAKGVQYLVGDLLKLKLERRYQLWHDRAVFHFLINDQEQEAYLEQVKAALVPGGFFVVGGFSPEGPERCSGQPVRRLAPLRLAELFGADFELEVEQADIHHTPGGTAQSYLYQRWRRKTI
ncbi:MAG: hypothetical protein A2508_04920 [Candidatus Lambdaproteobacteria bacterium RIFOXYD12_FULL_49_8]|nr:MAG: hypothetical protein A2508_04920 [Candidatus Lambdaproteobacteria bacterium RIFOXYD12_FULL_49_8]